MIPVGYLAKWVSIRPDSFHSERVVDIYSVSACISKNFAEYIPYWKHNGFWFFDSPEIIRQVAQANDIDLTGTRLFYYTVFNLEFDQEKSWSMFEPEPSFPTNVIVPPHRVLEGYDIVTFSVGTSPEHSPLSCNYLADQIETNPHCLLTSLEEAQSLLRNGKFKHTEPGPYRIFAVYSAEWT